MSSLQNAETRNIWDTPELICMICEFLDQKDRANMLCTSRHVFATILPIVWKDVGLQSVFHLIPGVNMRTESQQFYSYVFDFPDSADLTRFDFYAPFIKTLQVPVICVINNLPVEWAILTSSEAIAAKPLLPNLEHLKLDTSGPVEEIHIKWLSRFLCPGLLGFEMLPVSSRSDREDYYPWLDMNTSLHLIDQLSRACPRLKLLQIFPGETSLWPSGQREMMWSRIAELQHLRSLNFSGVKVYNELLNTLGRLPHLENLSFCANKNDPVNDDLPEFRVPLHVPDDSFPSLRNLYLQGLFEDTMNRLFKVPVLFRRSIIVKIIFAFQPFEYRLDMTERSNTLIECLSQNSPHLEDLTIGLLGKYGCFIVTRLAVDAFRHMHLRYLSLTIVNFDSDVELEDFLASVPHLEVLDLGLQQLEPDIFQPFGSHLPKLGLLFFGTIDLENAKELLEKVEQQAASQPIVLCGQAFLEHQWRQPGVPYSPPSDESIYNVARYILSIWPNATYEIQRAPWNCMCHCGPDNAAVTRLNAAMESLRATNVD
ncbi:hypothetical protein FRC12_003621 [Ceratobasidium sp. 428]|nr:hypothetical protein FRC12_003621 [Ceratobasidium sp. 428]